MDFQHFVADWIWYCADFFFFSLQILEQDLSSIHQVYQWYQHQLQFSNGLTLGHLTPDGQITILFVYPVPPMPSRPIGQQGLSGSGESQIQ